MGSSYSFTSSVCWAQQQSLFFFFTAKGSKQNSSSQIVLGRRHEPGMWFFLFKSYWGGEFLHSGWVKEFQMRPGSQEYGWHSPRGAVHGVRLLRLQQGLGGLGGSWLRVRLSNEEQEEAANQTDHSERDEHCLTVLVWNMSQSLKTTPPFGRSPLEAHFNKCHYKRGHLADGGQNTCSWHNNSKCFIIINKTKCKCCYQCTFSSYLLYEHVHARHSKCKGFQKRHCRQTEDIQK